MAIQVVAVGCFRRETVETYRRVLRHVLRDRSGAVLTCPGLLTGSKSHSQPDLGGRGLWGGRWSPMGRSSATGGDSVGCGLLYIPQYPRMRGTW